MKEAGFIMSDKSSVPQSIKKILSKIAQKEKKLLEYKLRLERQKIEVRCHEYDFDDFKLPINQLIQKLQKIKNQLMKKDDCLSEDNIIIQYSEYYSGADFYVSYYRYETDKEYQPRRQEVNKKITALQEEIQELKYELVEMKQFFLTNS